jgi:2-methylisocitrate lyase-like PEP mutase family enzyme
MITPVNAPEQAPPTVAQAATPTKSCDVATPTMQVARPTGPPIRNGRRPHRSDPVPAISGAIPQAIEVIATRFATNGRLVRRSLAMAKRNGARVVPLQAAANIPRHAAASSGQGIRGKPSGRAPGGSGMCLSSADKPLVPEVWRVFRSSLSSAIRIDPEGNDMSPPDRMRALLTEPGFIVMPAVWDGLSAKLAAAAGFKTAFMSGSCVAASRLGGPDLDLISFGEMFDSFNMVHAAAPDTLVLADGDHGYGNAMNVQRTVRAYGRAGAAAILIEDKITPRALTSAGKPCLPREEARMKIRAAVEAAKDSGILILARTDCRPTQGIDEAVARIEMYVQEGADIVFLDSPADDAEIHRAVAAAGGRPSFAVLSPGAPRATPSQTRAAELGFKIGTHPTGLLSPAAAGMQAGLAAIVAGEAAAASAMPGAELRTVLGYPAYDDQAKRFMVPG